MKKIDFKIVFDRARRIRRKSHLSNVALQRDHLSCLVCHLNQKKREELSFVEISNKSAKRLIFESLESSTKRQILESNSIIIFISSSQLNQSATVVSFFRFSQQRKLTHQASDKNIDDKTHSSIA